MASESELPTKIYQSAHALLLLGILSTCGYAVLLWLSRQFIADVPDTEKPTIWMLSIFALQFCCYAAALRYVVRLQPSKNLLFGIVGGACLFRAILLPSVPMHEIDIYRYIWDGAVLAEGVNPYQYAPQQVREAIHSPATVQDEGLQRLVAMQAQSDSLAYCLDKIHYAELSSPYPLVSQAVFASAAIVTPAKVTPHTRLVVMKLHLVLFDIATLLVVIALLLEAKLHPGLSIAYGWCPLVLKEVANGGHLDAIAIFLTTLAIWLLVRGSRNPTGKPLRAVTFAGMILALAIAAKIYPVVFLPLFIAVWFRRHSVRAALAGVLAISIPTTILLAPMFTSVVQNSSPMAETTQADASPTGLQAFFERWEMNDLIFMVVLENLRPQADAASEAKPWFVVVPDTWSKTVVSRSIALTNWSTALFSNEASPPIIAAQADKQHQLKNASFLLTRAITGGFLIILACWLAWRAAATPDPHAWCRAAMLTLAWFWLTSPTQNPWYWCWVLPLLPFAKYRTWYLMAGFSLLYYLRFWLSAHYPDPPILGTPYNGKYFFYFVVVWIEFTPCLLFLGLEWFLSRKKRSPIATVNKLSQ